MPSFGIGEILIILMAIVLFVRPEDLPKFVRNFGRIYGDFQRFLVRFRSYSKETLDELAQADIPTKTPNIPQLSRLEENKPETVSLQENTVPLKIDKSSEDKGKE